VGARSTRFGNIVVVVFLATQALDGILTYIGVSTYGLRMEGNPLLGWLMTLLGQGAALTATKVTASAFGIVLHLIAVHRVVAALAVIYLAVAIVPWIGLLFLSS
jgi:hypothetical protein